MARGKEFQAFWKEFLNSKERDILYVIGKGFDPRMCTGISEILSLGGIGIRNCLLIEYEEGKDSPSKQYYSLISRNMKILEDIFKKSGKINTKTINMWSSNDIGRHRIGSISAASIFQKKEDFCGYTDIIIDISSIPRGIYFPLIGKILYLLDKFNEENKFKPNLHIIICENVELDKRIIDSGIDDNASFVYGFTSDIELESNKKIPKLWVPILGENQANQLEKIYNFINPDEICPILPSPSINPLRADKIIIEYQEFLFDTWQVESNNFIYAAEQNPFDAYRQLHRLIMYYKQALKPLGGCKTILSALSSKLLSISALLTAYELKNQRVGLAQVETLGYEINNVDDEKNEDSELFSLLL